jgi:hypothetical protein
VNMVANKISWRNKRLWFSQGGLCSTVLVRLYCIVLHGRARIAGENISVLQSKAPCKPKYKASP